MTELEKIETTSGQFQGSANEIESIIENYKQLHGIYVDSFERLEKDLDGLPARFSNKVTNAKKVFENVKGTVDERQLEISNQLYSQGLVLLVGAAESITKETFRTLLIKNIRKVSIKRNVTLPVDKVLKAETDEQLAKLILEVLEGEGNPAEKLNFQNMKQLQGIMKSYLGIELSDDLMTELHEYWQIRHVIIHNASIIDQQFIDNLKKAKVPTQRYAIGEKIKVTRADYDKCFTLLILLFETFDIEMDRLQLHYVERNGID